jgi:hypothetical protein
MKNKKLLAVEYLSPPESELTKLAYSVCQRLAETEPEYQKQVIRSGFAKFLTVVIRIQVQQLNRAATESVTKVS